MNLRTRVLFTINSIPGRSYTNGQLARILNAPEASVRRATLTLENQGSISGRGQGTVKSPVLWYARQIEAPVEPVSEAQPAIGE
jgi:DNA-binding IclR family transcriptional regulator